jgi:N-acylglucosamine 2-epimerase
VFEWGWDNDYGGILYYKDVKNLPLQEYWHDMKFWWSHNEAKIATLLAFKLTGNEKYALWHKKIYDWSSKHFPDQEYGEWIGYLHRDGRISSTLKGNHWKGPFHLLRMQLNCWKYSESITVN